MYRVVYKLIPCNSVHRHAVFEMYATQSRVLMYMFRTLFIQTLRSAVADPLFASKRKIIKHMVSLDNMIEGISLNKMNTVSYLLFTHSVDV